MSRHFWVLMHRYAGLYLAFFLTVAGLTGSVLAFFQELHNWLNPPFLVAVQSKKMLDPFALRARALALEPHFRINSINLQPNPGEIFAAANEPSINPETQLPYPIKPLYLNPYTGEPVTPPSSGQLPDTHTAGYWPFTRQNILPFIYELHYSLALGETGQRLFGIAATIWTVDCFIGFYLTLPMRRKKTKSAISLTQVGASKALPSIKSPASFWQRWHVAWKIKWRASTERLNFDLHRAGGLWTWLMLLVFAWSGVAFNMNTTVYQPVMTAIFEMTAFQNFPVPNLDKPRPEPVLEFKEAYSIGKQLMAEQAKLKGFIVYKEQSFSYNPANGLYQYTVLSDRDASDMTGSTYVYFDGSNGALVRLFLPTGEKSGDTITAWLVNLHMAKIWGLPYKLLVFVMGLVVAMLSATGIYIWYKKRVARLSTKRIF